MDKILSARVDEATLHKIGALAQKLKTTFIDFDVLIWHYAGIKSDASASEAA